ncbi:alpha/beta fold hydrolase [Streptomyces sp. NPDC050095]|uniref:alpha/beta hydrolase n=2 Tax=unclassified Streptomyces TaxID=2593676 RepID=UPI0034123593
MSAAPASGAHAIRTDDGARLMTYVAGPATAPATMVLVHGLSVTADLWRIPARYLASDGYRVVRYDQRGHGHSTRGRVFRLSLDQLADDLDQVITTAAPAGPLILAGHSLGALTLQRLLARHPHHRDRIRGMLLVSATGRGARTRPGPGPRHLLLGAARQAVALACTLAPRAVDRIRRRLPTAYRHALRPRSLEPQAPQGPPPCRAGLRHTPTEDIVDLWEELVDYQLTAADRRALHSLGDRLRLLAGTHDIHIPAAETTGLADQLPAAQLHLAADATHALPVHQPGLVTRHLTQLATSTPAAGNVSRGRRAPATAVGAPLVRRS